MKKLMSFALVMAMTFVVGVSGSFAQQEGQAQPTGCPMMTQSTSTHQCPMMAQGGGHGTHNAAANPATPKP